VNEPVLTVRNLRKDFGRQTVFDDVSFSIQPGHTFALLGRNGAGKTTLIRILLGLTKPTAGSVQVLGHDPLSKPLELRRRVGYLAEDQTMYGWMIPLELCRFLKPFYPTWDQQLAEDYLDRFEIPRRTKISRLSKGQTVKLGLLAALAHRPEFVVLDDPALGLDPIARKEFNRELIEQLQAQGRTVFYSSHLLDEVEAVADTVAILDGGRIVRCAATETLRDEVKQVVLPVEAAANSPSPKNLLDVRQHGDQVVATIDQAAEFLEQLTGSGVQHTVVDLTLDEIFEAFVIGRRQDWPERKERLLVMSDE
jgi:ABC-2 type transport system ATP-binding protein